MAKRRRKKKEDPQKVNRSLKDFFKEKPKFIKDIEELTFSQLKRLVKKK